MPKIVHIANTNVEFEYALSHLLPLEKSLSSNPLCLQLQFLPLLYAQPDDLVGVTSFPTHEYLASLQQMEWFKDGLPDLALLHSIKPFSVKQCLSWGPSRQVQTWCNSRKIDYSIPKDWNIVCLVNSKEFSFRYTNLPNASLLRNESELQQWINGVEGPKVLKSCFGLSGQGNKQFEGPILPPRILAFCQKEWRQNRPVIGEPWLDRIHDFSTQWLIHQNKQIEFIGATRFETDPHGTYRGTMAGPEGLLFGSIKSYLQHHRQFVQKVLEEVTEMGFFGYIGFDALLYRDPHSHTICLYPLVEINARQTMSLVALRLQKRICSDQILELSFQPGDSSEFSLLPNQLIDFKGKTVRFNRQLKATILSKP